MACVLSWPCGFMFFSMQETSLRCWRYHYRRARCMYTPMTEWTTAGGFQQDEAAKCHQHSSNSACSFSELLDEIENKVLIEGKKSQNRGWVCCFPLSSASPSSSETRALAESLKFETDRKFSIFFRSGVRAPEGDKHQERGQAHIRPSVYFHTHRETPPSKSMHTPPEPG